MSERVRWFAWRWITYFPWVCPAHAHTRIFSHDSDRRLGIDAVCRRDAAANGSCWCGRLQETDPAEDSDG